MDIKLTKLIRDYQGAVLEALKLMSRSGIRMPSSRYRWLYSDVKQDGLLDGNVAYMKHGFGCTVYLPGREVDFDFGRAGEVDGFDAWRLFRFIKGNPSIYGFRKIDDIDECLGRAVAGGHLVCSDDSLYYVVGLARQLAVDVDSRLPGDMLPARNLDIVLVLHSHYFQVAELMLENYDCLLREWKKKNSLSYRNIVNLRIYMSSWLGYLAVTCEGFERLRMRLLLHDSRPDSFKNLIQISDVIGKLIKRNSNPLRKLRNSMFHLREDAEVIRRFFDPGENRISWARDLHDAFTNFFSAYRVLCEVHYSINGRRGELRVNREPPQPYTKG